MEFEDLKTFLEGKGIEHHPDAGIKPYLTMAVGGRVGMIAVTKTVSQLKELLIYLHGQKGGYPFVLLGGGSNVVFPDDYSRLVVIVNRTPEIAREKDHIIRVNSGVFNSRLMEWNIGNNIGGMEFLAGIPGTVGGAAAVNAGAFGKSISAILEKAEIVTREGEVKMVDNPYFQFTYRNSAFKYGREVILNVFLKYNHADSAVVKRAVEEKLNYRKENHPCSSYRSAGCFFKNPIINGKKISAGQLIEQLGFKGMIYKRLRVSGSHANFVINNGGAAFEDLKTLEDQVVGKAFKERGIKLEREVIYISPEGGKY
jgi:UDP-N-acetylmuramate dehydrogenase